MSLSGKAIEGELSKRRAQTANRISALQHDLQSAAEIAEGKACVYATGSFGRGEASPHSDLDIFIVGKSETARSSPSSALSRLDAIRLQADLIDVTRKLKFPEFSGDGKYLVRYTVHDLIGTLGTPEDDAENTFTARLLLLLESFPLLGEKVYIEILRQVVDAYWRDYDDHKDAFIPAFLANDILRLWRTFCVNYEARTERAPEEKKAKGKVRNYKLKHSRLLTCYSALLYLLAVHKRKCTVTPEDAAEMISLTPTQRIERLINMAEIADAHDALGRLLRRYEHFLETTNLPDTELITRFKDKKVARDHLDAAMSLAT